MSKWRPEGWSILTQKWDLELQAGRLDEMTMVERAVDTLLEELKRTGAHSDNAIMYLAWAKIPIDCKGHQSGWLVFIPD